MSVGGGVYPRWSTSTLSPAVDTTPADLDALEQHVGRCNRSRGPWFLFRCNADALHEFLGGRLVTTLLIAGAAVGAASLWL